MKAWEDNKLQLQNGKLENYLILKQKFGIEKYLTVLKNFDHRKYITKLRVVSHRLHIETGRYKKTPRELRICQQCSSNLIEDEIHFLTVCTKYDKERQELYKGVAKISKHFQNLDVKQQFFWLLNCEDHEILTLTAKFISNHIQR
jgi:hypothetical protein